MSHDKTGGPLPGPDPLQPQDLGYEDAYCSLCGANRYHHYTYVPFHLEVSCQVCGYTKTV